MSDVLPPVIPLRVVRGAPAEPSVNDWPPPEVNVEAERLLEAALEEVRSGKIQAVVLIGISDGYTVTAASQHLNLTMLVGAVELAKIDIIASATAPNRRGRGA